MTASRQESITSTQIWQDLEQQARQVADLKLCDLFRNDNQRASKLSQQINGLFVDYSRQKITDEILSLLYALSRQENLEDTIQCFLAGEKVNRTENRPALHTALRSRAESLLVDSTDVMGDVRSALASMQSMAENIQSGKICGASGKKFTRVINLGIGGSDLGPRLAVQALQTYQTTGIEVQFVANIDYQDLYEKLQGADPETTLFIIASKSFSTLETLENAKSARQWLNDHDCEEAGKHFVAVTANRKAAIDFGIQPDAILDFGSWVGGRYSLWSTIGLPLALSIGMDAFRELLDGANAMDNHFATSPLEKNIPVTMALIDIWNNNFLEAETLAVIPYDHSLSLLPDYLSQLMMESNGKNVTQAGETVNYHTGTIVWGAVGTNGQHAFFQLLHQGTRNIPVEFLMAINSNVANKTHQLNLVANCIAQSEALMTGRPHQADEPYRNYPGNRPSTTWVYNRLTPYTLGLLLAMYEHRTFVQASIWHINAFDQWGVELGKEMAGVINKNFSSVDSASTHDASTQQLIDMVRKGKLPDE